MVTTACALFIILMKTPLSLAKSYSFKIRKTLLIVLAMGVLVFTPVTTSAKAPQDQDQIILLNDSAAALEDSNPVLSKSLSQFADEKQKEWEDKNNNKGAPAAPVVRKNIKQERIRIRLLEKAALVIAPVYPLIAQGLNRMARDLRHEIENEK